MTSWKMPTPATSGHNSLFSIQMHINHEMNTHKNRIHSFVSRIFSFPYAFPLWFCFFFAFVLCSLCAVTLWVPNEQHDECWETPDTFSSLRVLVPYIFRTSFCLFVDFVPKCVYWGLRLRHMFIRFRLRFMIDETKRKKNVPWIRIMD